VCAPLKPDITLPTQNLGLAAAIALDIVNSTPEAVATSYPWFARVLPPSTTPLTALLSQHPTIVSVELGANELLNATSGLIAPGVTVVPFPYFAQPYDAALDAIGSTHAQVVLVGLPVDGSNLPALRRGSEIWADRDEFTALHVDVSPDCDGNQNFINVSIKSVNLALTAAFTSAHGLPNPVYSCADVPGTQDEVLTPSDMAALNGMLAQFDGHIREQAAARGYAYFTLGALYARPDLKPATYSVVTQLSSKFPYGPYTSLDGVHPNALGQTILAIAAGSAINKAFNLFGVHAVVPAMPAYLNQMEAPVAPSQALARAREFVNAHRGEQVALCPMPGGCRGGLPRR
jgi:lysophospholipase L1-like esterase